MTDPTILEQTVPSNPDLCASCDGELNPWEDDVCDHCIKINGWEEEERHYKDNSDEF